MFVCLGDTTLLNEGGFFAVVHESYLKHILGLEAHMPLSRQALCEMTQPQLEQYYLFKTNTLIFNNPFGEDWRSCYPWVQLKHQDELKTIKMIGQSPLTANDKINVFDSTYPNLRNAPFAAFTIAVCYCSETDHDVHGRVLMVFDRRSGDVCTAFVPQCVMDFIANRFGHINSNISRKSFWVELSEELKSFTSDRIVPKFHAAKQWTRDKVHRMTYAIYRWRNPNPNGFLDNSMT